VEINIITSAEQTLKTMDQIVYPGGNFIPIDFNGFAKGLYLVSIHHTVSGKIKYVKLLN